MADYDIQSEADSINTALLQVHSADTVPVATSDKMIRSGAVYTMQQDLDAARIAGDDALDGRVTTLEAGTIGYYNYSVLATGSGGANATFTALNSLAGAGGAPSGAGSNTLTLPSNYCEVSVGASLADQASSFDDTYRISLKIAGVSVAQCEGPSGEGSRTSITLAAGYLSEGSQTVQVTVTSINGAGSRGDLTGTLMIRSLPT